MEFNTKSYALHADSYKASPADKIRQWKNEDTVDYWRHFRMYKTIIPVLKHHPDARWLTVGDGKYGTDAHFISKYTPHVVASDIAEDCLKTALDDGYIPEYKIENAEKMSFADNSFDFVFCKEAYHHFPRPAIAVYEMLRVARKGIILLEPNDPNSVIPQKMTVRRAFFWFLQSLKNYIKERIGRQPYYSQGGYEPVGNFVYFLSEREVEKFALGLNYDMVAIKGINDEYIDGVEFELLKDKGPLYTSLSRIIEQEDCKVMSGKRDFGLMTAIIFKEMPGEACIEDLRKEGFRVTKLIKNPYL